MAIQHNNREHILEVLKTYSGRDRAELLKALYDIRYNTGKGDDAIIVPLLSHVDDGVVASAMFTLWHSYNARSLIEPLARKLSLGDERDRMDMPIQSMAITLLSELAGTDASARAQLLSIAEDENVNDSPRTCAWERLAYISAAPWKSEYTEELIMSPMSETSNCIRNGVRKFLR